MSRTRLERIMVNAMTVCGVSEDMLYSSERAFRMVLARELIVTAGRLQDPPYSYPTLGWAIGKRCHTTAVTAFQRVESKYPKGRIVGEFLGMPATFQDLLAIVMQDTLALHTALIDETHTKAVCA